MISIYMVIEILNLATSLIITGILIRSLYIDEQRYKKEKLKYRRKPKNVIKLERQDRA